MKQKVYKIPLSSFCLGYLLLGMGPTLNVFNILSENPLKTINFFPLQVGVSYR